MNDMLLNMLANDSFTVSDFKAVGLTAENTKLESEDRYLQSQMIQDNLTFKDINGNFSKDKFHQYYLLATDYYNKMADDNYIEDLSKNTFYSKDNLFAPEQSKKFDETPVFVTVPNPFLQSNSLTRVGKKGDRTLSISEIAQTQKIYNSKTKTFEKDSVNDRVLGKTPLKWLGDVFSEPLVIAQWDEDGEHEDLLTGEIKSHKKGDYKYNEDGVFYYETLNGRDVYGKQVLNRMNTLTVDGSKINRYDFFDSDDLEQKSIVGSTFKNLALVGSMFIPWNVGNVIKAANIATQSIGLLGALSKMFLGSENEFANNMHAWAKTVNRQSVSEYASQNTWCWENFINLIGDSVGQIAEQRFLFTHAPALFKGTKGIDAKNTKKYKEILDKESKKIRDITKKDLDKAIASSKSQIDIAEYSNQWVNNATLKAQSALEEYLKSYNNLGSIMSKAYMTGITVQDTYGEAKANGASDLEAFFLTLGYAAGELAILNSPIGEWMMPELHGQKLKYTSIANAIKKQVQPLSKNISEASTPEAKKGLIKSIFNIGKRLATDDYARAQFVSETYNPMKVVLAHAAGESLEELSEEVLADVSKSAFNAINWLRGDETRIASVWENIIDRYGMSVLGGFFGGGISSAGTDFSYARELGKMTNEKAIQEIIYMVNNDQIDDFLKFINKNTIGNKYLSFDRDENGNFKPGDEKNNQDLEIKSIINQSVKIVKDIINAEGAKFSENSLFDAVTLKDLRYLQLRDTAAAGALFQEWNTLLTDIYNVHEKINNLTGIYTNTDSNKKELTVAKEKELKKLNETLKDLRKRKEAIVSGKRAPEFIAIALYEAQKALHGENKGYTFEGFVQAKENKSIDELSESRIKELKESYQEYRKSEMKNDIINDAKQFIYLSGLASKSIKEQEDIINESLKLNQKDSFILQNLLTNVFYSHNSNVNSEDFDPDTFIENIQNNLIEIKNETIKSFTNSLLNQTTLDRLNYIENAPESEVYTKEMKKLDKSSVILEAFGEYIDSISLKFIEQDYIHPEIKNHLINTYDQAINILNEIRNLEFDLGVKKDNIIDEAVLKQFSAYYNSDNISQLFQSRSELLSEYVKNLNSNKNKIKKLNSSPIVDLLEKFKIATSESDISVKNVIKTVNNLLDQNQQDLSAFGYGIELENQIDEVEQIVDFLSSVIYGARVDQAGINNAWGYSKTLNELNKKYGNKDWVELAEIEGKTADLIQQDLLLLKQKLVFAKNLRAINNGQKLNKQNKVGYNKQYIFFNKFRHWVNELPDDLSGWNLESIKSIIFEDLLLFKYNNVNNKERTFGLTSEEKIQIEKESLMIDDAIYKFFEDNNQKLQNVDELTKVINADLFNLYDPANKLLTDEISDLDDRQFIFSLGARAALKKSQFQNILRKTYNDKIAPVAMQEEAVYLNTAMILNGNILNNFAKVYSKSLFEHFKNSKDLDRRRFLKQLGYSDYEINEYATNPDLFQLDGAVDKFANIILTEGIAGSGKTKSVFKTTKEVIKQIDPKLIEKVYLVNSTLKNAEDLMKDLELKGTAFTSSHSEINEGIKSKKNVDLIRHFYSDYDENYKDHVKIFNNKVVTNYKLNKDLSSLPKIIFIDEASRYDYIQMKLLSEAAQHYGIVILAAGDFDQISAESIIPYKSEGISFAPQRLNFIGGSKLGLSFRTLNSQMSKNQKEILANLYSDKKDINIFYWENESEIRGFKHYDSSDFDEIVKSVNKIKELIEPDEKIGFLYADENKSIYKKLKEKFGDLLDIKSIDDAQGLEGNYYILDLNRNYLDTLQKEKQELYTGITRAKIGGIIISDNDVQFQNVNINSIKEASSELEYINEKAIAKTSQKRKEIFDEIFKDYQEESIKYQPITIVTKTSEIIPTEDSFDEGILPPIKQTVTINIPIGTYINREDAEKIDLSTYKSGYELYKDDELIGVIQGTDIIEHKENDTIYYAPVVIVSEINGNTVSIYAEELTKYTLKDPSSDVIIPKYNIETLFYNNEGASFEIIEIINENPIKYKLKEENGNIITILETELSNYSTIQPVPKPSLPIDLGENEDPEKYKSRVEVSNGTNLKSNVLSDGRIKHRLYTFNGYETGVLWKLKDSNLDENDPENYIIDEQHFDLSTTIGKLTSSRIDNINGLRKLAIVGKNTSKNECLNILSNIHSILMYNKNNSDVLTEIQSILGVKFSSIEYGIKSSAGFKFSDKYPQYNIFAKNPDEKLEYTNKNVLDSDSVSNKTFVAIFRDSTGKKSLEITMGVLNSPITLGQITDENNNYIYPEVAEILFKLKPNLDGEKVFEILMEAMNSAKDNNYIDLYNLFKAYLYTSNGFIPMNKDFNLAKEINYGPQVIMNKGLFQTDGTRQYSVNYMNLQEFIKDDRKIVSDIYIPADNEYDGKIYPVHKGYPGVFVTYNKKYDSSQLADIYMQQINSDEPKDVEFYYIIPPEATIEEYLKNIRNIYLNNHDGEHNPIFSIGNKWTAYNLLKNVHLKEEFTEEKFSSRLLNRVKSIDAIKALLDELINIENADYTEDQDYKEAVEFYKDSGYSDIASKNYAKRSIIIQKQHLVLNRGFGGEKVPVYKVFSNYLANAAYWNHDDVEPYPEIVELLKKHNHNNIKYKVEYSDKSRNGLFIPAKVNSDNKYQIDGITSSGNIVAKEFSINDKIDPPVYEIPALTNAIGQLADWEFENENDTNSRKLMGNALRQGTNQYLNDSNTISIPENNFIKLKKNNKNLFGKSGKFNNIKVKNESDPNLTQLDFAKEILEEFNSKPDNIGFAIIQPNGDIKMYGLNLNDLDESFKISEKESLKGLGGIILNKPLIFETLNDEFEYVTDSRIYTIRLNSENIVFEYYKNQELKKELVKITESSNNSYTEEEFENLKNNKSQLTRWEKSIFNIFDKLSFNELINVDQNTIDSINNDPNITNENFKELIKYLNSDKTNIQSINIKPGNKVIRENLEQVIYEVESINESIITLKNIENNEDIIQIDITQTENNLYKIEDEIISTCTTYISIPYGK